MPHPPYSLDLTPSDFVFVYFPVWKKSSKGNLLLMCKRWNKNIRSTKRHQNWRVQKLFRAVEKSLYRYSALNGRVIWRGLKFKHVHNFFINKFQGLGVPLIYQLIDWEKHRSNHVFVQKCSSEYSTWFSCGKSSELPWELTEAKPQPWSPLAPF